MSWEILVDFLTDPWFYLSLLLFTRVINIIIFPISSFSEYDHTAPHILDPLVFFLRQSFLWAHWDEFARSHVYHFVVGVWTITGDWVVHRLSDIRFVKASHSFRLRLRVWNVFFDFLDLCLVGAALVEHLVEDFLAGVELADIGGGRLLYANTDFFLYAV